MKSPTMTTTQHILAIKLEDNEKFNGKNWSAFKLAMLTEGNTRGLINYWENKVTIPETTIAAQPNTPMNSMTPNQLKYIQCKSVMLTSIIHNVKNIYSFGLNPLEPSHKAWAHLKAEYNAYSDLIRSWREKTLKAMVYEEGEKVSGDGGYIEKMRKLWQEANNASVNINDDQFKTTLFDSFPESWDSIISTLYAEKSLTIITAHLIAHGKRVVGQKATSSAQGDSVQALQASVQVLTLQVQNLTAKKNSTLIRSDKSHPANDNCKDIGHTLEECWKLRGGCQRQYPLWWKGKWDAPLPSGLANLTTTSQSDHGSITMNVIALNACVNKETLEEIDKKTAGEDMAWVVNNHNPGLDTSQMYGDSGAC